MKVRRQTLLLYGAVVGLFALILGWWVVFFLGQGDVLVKRVQEQDAGLTEAQAALVRDAALRSSRMFFFEGAFLVLLLLAGVVLVLRSLRQEAQLYKRQRDFLSSITHELRSPIASARLFLESLLLDRVPEGKKSKYLRSAHRDLDRLNDVIDNLISSATRSAKTDRGPRGRIDLGECTAGTVARVIEGDDRDVELALHCDDEVLVDAHPAEIETIVRNLVSNALKYGGDPPRIDVRVEPVDGCASVSVRDYGPGLQGAKPSQIVNAFERGDSELVKTRPGVGLGLYLVAELAREIGGELRAGNADDGGDGFAAHVRLPLAKEVAV